MSRSIHHLQCLGNQFHYWEFMNVWGLHTSLQGLPSSNEEIKCVYRSSNVIFIFLLNTYRSWNRSFQYYMYQYFDYSEYSYFYIAMLKMIKLQWEWSDPKVSWYMDHLYKRNWNTIKVKTCLRQKCWFSPSVSLVIWMNLLNCQKVCALVFKSLHIFNFIKLSLFLIQSWNYNN